MAKTRISEFDGRAALDAWGASGDDASRTDRATAVRFTLQALADRAPGASVEVRVPPFGAVQCIEGPGHTRGTPPNVIETDTGTWLGLATGTLTWDDAVAASRVKASGTRATLGDLLPIVRLR